jgi:hypothetical protein
MANKPKDNRNVSVRHSIYFAPIWFCILSEIFLSTLTRSLVIITAFLPFPSSIARNFAYKSASVPSEGWLRAYYPASNIDRFVVMTTVDVPTPHPPELFYGPVDETPGW